MKRFYNKIAVCLIPVILSGLVVGWAYSQYEKGRGGFRLGVDLSGGTILVYEVDVTKMPANFKAADLAAALKRRIDPADLLNVTIRPVEGNPPRVEIILPTGGTHQAKLEQQAWTSLLAAVTKEYPVQGKDDPYGGIRRGEVATLEAEIKKEHKDVAPQAISAFIQKHYSFGGDHRALTTEEVENIKALIGKQGRLEFRILANNNDDREGISQAQAWIKNPANKDELTKAAIQGTPPPPPRAEDGSPDFVVNLHGDTHRYSYSWVEIGKAELYTLGLNSKALKDNSVMAARVDEAVKKPEAIIFGNGFLLYARDIPNPDRVRKEDRALGKTREYFLLTRITPPNQEVTGEFLTSARGGPGEGAGLAVHFNFNTEGGNRFYDITYANRPDGKEGFHRNLAIVLDAQIQSAPRLNSPIRGSGMITGEFTQKEIDQLVTILRAGALPATLKDRPVSENSMGATLGEDTIRKGTLAVGIAFLAVLAFMLLYYRFAGLVACIALLANLLLTIAFMVLVSASFTLPGLAGLVLMLGMAVDANVLIYERLREERERGASLALAVRNGYDRAFPTIIDTHLSSIFTAIVLYVVGNDQLKGFGISLTVGLIISLFTSLYMTRVMFDLWNAKGWLHKLSMANFKDWPGLRWVFRRDIDFMAIRYYWFTATLILTILGAGLFIWRLDKGGLNIDFVGGTAYTGRLVKPMKIEALRNRLETGSTLPDLSVELIFVDTKQTQAFETGNSDWFTVRTTEKDRVKVLKDINDRLGPDLKKVELAEFDVAKDAKSAAETKSATLVFKAPDTGKPDFASPAQVTNLLTSEFRNHDLANKQFRVVGDPKDEDKERPGLYSRMKLILEDPISRGTLTQVLEETQTQYRNSPQPERLENFDSQLAATTQERALYAILASWAAILLYLWFRFGSWTFGAAAVICLVHDLFFTLGAIALCHYIYVYTPGLANVLGVRDFKIDLTTIAALLTLVGYSVSDTIVVFDRIREVRGKNPLLTPQMINDSVNQTLGRTLLSSLSVWLVVFVLYVFGGEGVHLFAFVMVIGVIVGTYSSIYIASPLLLIFGEGVPARERRPVVQPAPGQA